MRANFVDRILARVDGELAPIWITELITTDAPPRADDLRAGLARLVAETPRLSLAWDPSRGDWAERPRRAEDLDRAVRELAPGPSWPDLTSRLLVEPLDLTRELPLRISLAPAEAKAKASGALLAVQLHHAVGDARSMMHLNRRLWQLLSGRARPDTRLGPARMSDARALAAAARRAFALPALLDPRHRLLARRGQPLRRRGAVIGAPMLRSLRAPLSHRFTPEARSRLFFGALLAGMIAHDEGALWDAPLRLRVPVDLRRELGIGPTLENACSAVPVELSGARVRERGFDPEALSRLVPDELSRLIRAGVPWATLVECLVVSRVATTAALREHVRPDLVAARRANTMITTYVGTVDRYFEDAPFPIRSLRTHTPTWGANGYAYNDELVINVTAFEGLWSREDLAAFVGSMGAFLRRHYGLAPEVSA
jgi:hypothetical protein